MSTKLKAGTATSGAVIDADTAGILELQSGSTPTTAITVDASQNVGIGTTSPTTKFEVVGVTTATASNSSLPSLNVKATIGANNGPVIGLLNGSTAIGYVGAQSFIQGTGGSDANLAIGAGTGNAITFFTNNSSTERMRIDSSGNIGIGITNPATWNPATTTIGVSISPSNITIQRTGNVMAFYYASTGTPAGVITTTGANSTSYTTSSDYRLKENIAPMKGALNKVSALKPVIYDWKSGGSSQGFIAHELAEVVPECVIGEKDAVDAEGNPVYQGIDTSFLVATLTAAIQEQQVMIQELNAKVTSLEEQVLNLGVK